MNWTSIPALPILTLGAAIALAQGCRPPNDDYWEPDASGFDASVDDAGPGAACPEGSPDLFNNAYNPYMGGDEAVDLEVVDISFFKCPHCAEFAQLWNEVWATRPDIRARVRLYYHHYPFDYQASWEVHAATVAAGNQGMEHFWQLHDYIYDGAYYDAVQYNLDEIRAYCADVLQLEMTQFEADLADPYTYSFLAWDKEQAQAAGVGGTPSVFICGEKISWGSVEAEIDAHLGID